jgi:palmitoyltransferase
MILISLYKASTTDPGTIPKAPEWEIVLDDSSESGTDKITVEKRKDGSLRTCNHCQLRKPDRCHHCKQCDRCNLKMDHHCNWIANCVGSNNYKYFFLLVLYSALTLGLFIGTFWEVLVVTLCDKDSREIKSLSLATVYSLMILLEIAVGGFLIFHIWLISKNFTTIEFCEKKRGKVPTFANSPYSSSTFTNFKEALGPNPWLWAFPVDFSRPKDSGLYFASKNNN